MRNPPLNIVKCGLDEWVVCVCPGINSDYVLGTDGLAGCIGVCLVSRYGCYVAHIFTENIESVMLNGYIQGMADSFRSFDEEVRRKQGIRNQVLQAYLATSLQPSPKAQEVILRLRKVIDARYRIQLQHRHSDSIGSRYSVMHQNWSLPQYIALPLFRENNYMNSGSWRAHCVSGLLSVHGVPSDLGLHEYHHFI